MLQSSPHVKQILPMDLIPSAIASDLSISAVYLPREFLDYWSTIARFASNESVIVTPNGVASG